jgi:ATP-binding cassette subfamily B protein
VNIVTDLAQAVTVFIVMASIEWRLTLISTAILPLFILAARLLAEKLRDTARQQLEANAGMNAMINETLNIGGALLVKLFGQQENDAGQFRQRAGDVRDLGVKRAVIGSVFFMIVGLLSAVGTALVYGFGGWQVILGRLSIGTIVALGSYLTMLYSSLQSLANAPVEFSTSVVSFERVFEVLDLPVEIDEKPDALELGKVNGQIRFEHVWFEYNDHPKGLLNYVQRYGRDAEEKTVLTQEAKNEIQENADTASQARRVALRDINFDIQPGQLTALVGPSGAGKTTLTYLVPRLYDPNQGRILLDGHDLRDLKLDALIAQIGMVTQETFLFHDTITANLRFANPQATREQIVSAARAANIHDFITDLPDKYETIVGERGYRLSGGEKQRIALARVILKDPRILILDEATSSLDSQSEALIQEALKRVLADAPASSSPTA